MKRSTTWAGLACTLATACAFQPGAWAADTGAQSLRIPRVVGLTTVRAFAEPRGDYESIGTTTSVANGGQSMVLRAEVPRQDGSGTQMIQVARTVPAADRQGARTMRMRFNVGDPEVFAGTSPGISLAVFKELRTAGSATFTFLDVQTVFGITTVEPLKGTLRRVGNGAMPFSTIVNGRRSTLQALHAKAVLGDGLAAQDFEIQVLDDADNPLVLAVTGPGFKSRVTRIEFPLPPDHADSIESTLAARRPADVYGIYFAFGSDVLRPESEPVLREVAALMRRHPDWKLQIDGHTDHIGESEANLDLSRRRAAAVKAALVRHHATAADRLATGGWGEDRPKDDNRTVEGRALNRRVELRRL
jgi:outer membrane protein OmpA-like peptidoglycan-associated protein